MLILISDQPLSVPRVVFEAPCISTRSDVCNMRRHEGWFLSADAAQAGPTLIWNADARPILNHKGFPYGRYMPRFMPQTKV